jgi:hypothetical protein
VKKAITFLVLLLYINTSMVRPAVDEVDSFDHCGRQLDDINSLLEFIDQIVLGNQDDTPEDEDDDKANLFDAAAKNLHLFTQFHFAFHDLREFAVSGKKTDILPEHLYFYTFSEVPTPPPDSKQIT